MLRRPSRVSCALSLLALATAATTLSACLEHPVKPVLYESSAVCKVPVDVTPRREVDILFVIDNSGSMGEEQAILSANFDRFVDKLDTVGANYRIAVTTTDVGNPIYCGDSTPENGAFVLSTCHDRIDEFESEKLGLDKRAEACEQFCPAELAGTVTIPSALEQDGEQLARPWIEFLNGATNLPEGVSTAQAFQCFGPQGISGCGYNESPLEAMHRALARASDPGDPAYGFIRDDAFLAVVFITDENDCSLAEGAEDIFHPAGNRAFWEDPTLAGPTSAVCWNAGVACDEAGNCDPADYDAEGNLTSDPSEAVLSPLSFYDDSIAAFKNALEDTDIMVSVIAGVPLDYPDSPIPYADSPDPDIQLSFGVAPGCESPAGGTATPPVRLREFAGSYTDANTNNLFSICADDYSPALDELASRIEKNIKPACLTACARDTNVEQDGLQVNCDVVEQVGEDRSTAQSLPHCERDGGGWITPESGACYFEITEDDDAFDDGCVELGANLQFEVLRAPGTLPPSGSTISAECELSDKAQIDCPLLKDPC